MKEPTQETIDIIVKAVNDGHLIVTRFEETSEFKQCVVCSPKIMEAIKKTERWKFQL